MSFSIRRATLTDVSILAQLIQPVHRIHVEAHPEIFKMPDDWSAVESLFAVWLTQMVVFIGEENGQSVGYVMCEDIFRPADLLHIERHEIYIHQISLNDDVRGKGYGRKLIEAVIDFSREQGATRVGLDYWVFNSPASEFFVKMGFQPTNTHTYIQLGN